jgi:streptogramin lyase
MRFSELSLALCVSIAGTMLAGCGGPQAPIESGTMFEARPMPQATRLSVPEVAPEAAGWLPPAAKHGPRIYVANGNQVLIFPEKGELQIPIGLITAGVNSAYGLFVDKDGNLYVANNGNSTVTVYPPGATSPSQTYSQGLSYPLYPIVDSSGNLWVSGNGTVIEYLKGSTSVHQVLQSPGSETDGMDFDREGNLYVAYRNSTVIPGSIEEFSPGDAHGVSLGMTLNQPQGLIVDKNRNILVVETGGTNRIDFFPPGDEIPTIVVPIPNTPTQLAIRSDQSTLSVSSLAGIVYGTRYPFGTSPHPVYAKDEVSSLIQGVAISNGQSF